MRAAAMKMSPLEALQRFDGLHEQGVDATAAVPDDAPPRYGFDVGNLSLLMPENIPSELVELGKPSPLPGTQRWLRGLVNLRGNLVPVFDLAQLVDSDDTNGPLPGVTNVVPIRRQVLLVLGKGEQVIGLALDDLPRACRRESMQAQPLPSSLPEVLAAHVSEAWGEGDRVWLEFDLPSLFGALRELVAAE